MLYKFWREFIMIYNAWRIPKLPRVFASKYTEIPPEVVDVMRRLGCRDPRGVQAAMRRYNVTTIKELVTLLEYQRPKRSIRHRVWLGLARIVGQTDKPTHQAEILRSGRSGKKSAANLEIQQRIQKAKEYFR